MIAALATTLAMLVTSTGDGLTAAQVSPSPAPIQNTNAIPEFSSSTFLLQEAARQVSLEPLVHSNGAPVRFSAMVQLLRAYVVTDRLPDATALVKSPDFAEAGKISATSFLVVNQVGVSRDFEAIPGDLFARVFATAASGLDSAANADTSGKGSVNSASIRVFRMVVDGSFADIQQVLNACNDPEEQQRLWIHTAALLQRAGRKMDAVVAMGKASDLQSSASDAFRRRAKETSRWRQESPETIAKDIEVRCKGQKVRNAADMARGFVAINSLETAARACEAAQKLCDELPPSERDFIHYTVDGAWHALIVALMADKRFSDAEALIIKRSAHPSEHWLSLGYAYLAAGETAKAETVFDKCTADPRDANPLRILKLATAREHLLNGNKAVASRILDSTLANFAIPEERMIPGNGEIDHAFNELKSLAQALYSCGEIERASTIERRAAKRRELQLAKTPNPALLEDLRALQPLSELLGGRGLPQVIEPSGITALPELAWAKSWAYARQGRWDLFRNLWSSTPVGSRRSSVAIAAALGLDGKWIDLGK